MPSPFPSDRLVLLGTKGGPAIRKGGPSPTSHLLVIGGHPYVIDCGLGVTRALVEAGMALPELRNIIITHLHSDHVLEMGPLVAFFVTNYKFGIFPATGVLMVCVP